MKNLIFGKNDCTFCNMAKDLFKSKGLNFSYHDVSNSHEMDTMVKECNAYGISPRTIPQIFMGGEYIGGYTELFERLNEDSENLEVEDIYVGEL